MADRTFTLDEAQMLLPVLEALLRQAIEARKQLLEFEEEFQRLTNRIFLHGGILVDVGQVKGRRDERDAVLQRLKDSLAEIGSMGVQVKDLDTGLLDFPCKVEDEIILLCWKLGEKKIAHWHNSDEGFRGRKPIDDRIARAKPDKPV